jgi:hypothetical protein
MHHRLAAAFGLIAGALLIAIPAAAQNTQSWVASTGSDSNACTRAAPCATFTRAHAQTNAGGRIGCVDRVTQTTPLDITKSITIDCEPGGVLRSSGGAGISIFAPASDTVHLRGLTIDGLSVATGAGLDVLRARAVFVDNVTIRGFTAAGIRVSFAALGSGTRLFVTDAVIANNGDGATGSGGIILPASANRDIRLTLTRSVVEGNRGDGLRASNSGSATNVSAEIRESSFIGNTIGINVLNTNAAGTARVTIRGSQVAGSTGAGISAGPDARVVARKVRITANGTGVSATGNGSVVSAGGNVLAGNGTNGAFTATMATQ